MNYTPHEYDLLSTEDVLGYILVQNAARNAQAVAEGWEFWTTIPVRLDFVAEFKNAYELELRFARGTYSDVYKDWCGCRPSINLELTLSELEMEIDRLSKMAAAAYQDELEWRAEEERQIREDIALGVKAPTPDVELEQWEIYENKAEMAGY